LHYGTLLGSRACAHMAAAAWASAFLNALMHTANAFSLPLCHGNALGQFFCEMPQILKLSCSKSYLREIEVSLFSISIALGCFVFIVFSYVQIFRAVLRIPSEQGRHKAFSTCLPHLAVVLLFLSTGFFAYLKPPSMSSPSLDLVVSVLYSVVPPIRVNTLQRYPAYPVCVDTQAYPRPEAISLDNRWHSEGKLQSVIGMQRSRKETILQIHKEDQPWPPSKIRPDVHPQTEEDHSPRGWEELKLVTVSILLISWILSLRLQIRDQHGSLAHVAYRRPSQARNRRPHWIQGPL
ncbi:olfactory receptor 14J1-like, partial [Melospiza georgiana]|uniref:olfactory receptor 14J1-like n=1 Tax=Melospiza georgiana TaxID=44398 RepID=UPI0025ABB38E